MAATFPVSEAKVRELAMRLRRLGVEESDLTETFFRTERSHAGVELRYAIAGIRVRCQREKSQGLNRFFARRMLAEELEARRKELTRHEAKAAELRECKRKRQSPKGRRSVREIVVGQFLLRSDSDRRQGN